MTDERWLDILARAIIKKDDERKASMEKDDDREVWREDPDTWTEAEFAEMEAWAHEVFKPLRDEDHDVGVILDRVKAKVMAEVGKGLG